MATPREPQQIAKRALILGAVSFRSSLEVTTHPRVTELAQRLFPWLAEMGCHDEIDPIERELLETPVGRLGPSLRADANWAGEAATFFCWMLGLVPPMEEARLANPSCLPDVLFILKPKAAEVIRSATLRDRGEIEDTCRHFVLIRSILQESRVEGVARNVVRQLNLRKLGEVGLAATEDAVTRASEAVSRMTPEERRVMAGAYFVRDHAAFWYLSGRASYFA